MVAKDLWEYIKSNCAPYASITMDGLSKEKESISIQQGRANPIVDTYMNGDIYGQFVFDVRAKSMDRTTANIWLENTVNHFKQQNEIPLEDGRVKFNAFPTVSPYLLERTEEGGYIYTASFTVTYDEKGE